MKKNLEYIPLVLLCLFTGKLMITTGWNMDASAVLIALAGVVCLFQYTAKNKQIESLQKQLTGHSDQFDAMKKEMEVLRSHVSGLKLGSSMKPAVRGF